MTIDFEAFMSFDVILDYLENSEYSFKVIKRDSGFLIIDVFNIALIVETDKQIKNFVIIK